ncbi:hypothetical protein MZD04_gp119 [Pseudomonas phage Psa21]|uniref:Uncharacterized protein n=1 Tax=Pseudomonas phage Psa21 TaxID=2530023 RepID=A0A481W5W1_9CAUD|nr:hypothetical protein MZD04_gp119 [Pseudomonas phage Psa21]QBJ02647.1 hypothetical protein PSA21_119 [Pseudomonas phage Psa21]
MDEIKVAAMVLIGGVHFVEVSRQFDKPQEHRDVPQMLTSGAIVTLCAVGIATIVKRQVTDR